MNRLHRQLFGGLDRHEAHVWSADCLADGFGVIPIVLVGLHIRRDKLGTDQPNIMTKLRNRLRPKVRAVRSLHADETRGQVCEEWQNRMTTKRLAYHRPSMSVDAVNLEDIFRQIHTNGYRRSPRVRVLRAGLFSDLPARPITALTQENR